MGKDLKSFVRVTVPGVRIPLPPLFFAGPFRKEAVKNQEA